MPAHRPSARTLVLTFAAVGLAFLAATAYAEYHAKAIDKMALDIAENAAPSIEYLTAARAELRHMQVLTEDHLAVTRGRPSSKDDVLRSRAEFKQQIEKYLQLPVFPGEREIWNEVSRGLPRVDEALDRALNQIESGDRDGAEATVRGDLRRAVDESTAAMLTSVNFDARRSQELARDIEEIRGRSMVTAFLLDGLCIVLSIVAGLLASRAVRSYAGLLEEHNRLVERRAQGLEDFAGRVAHDILSPLYAVGLGVGGALEEAGDESQVRTYLDPARRSLDQVKVLVDGLLDFARSGAEPDPGSRAEVNRVLEGLIAELAPMASSARIELAVDPIPACVAAVSPGVLTSLAGNLLRNAIKYMGDAHVRRVSVRVRDRGLLLRFEVEDTGPGIPPELGERIFQPHVRGFGLKQPGIGLGLATVKRLAEAHGGQVGLRSQPGKGSCFWFELPRAAEAARPLAASRQT